MVYAPLGGIPYSFNLDAYAANCMQKSADGEAFSFAAGNSLIEIKMSTSQSCRPAEVDPMKTYNLMHVTRKNTA